MTLLFTSDPGLSDLTKIMGTIRPHKNTESKDNPKVSSIPEGLGSTSGDFTQGRRRRGELEKT